MNEAQLKIMDDMAKQLGTLVQGFSALLSVVNENVRNLDILGLTIRQGLPEALERAIQEYNSAVDKPKTKEES